MATIGSTHRTGEPDQRGNACGLSHSDMGDSPYRKRAELAFLLHDCFGTAVKNDFLRTFTRRFRRISFREIRFRVP